MQLEFLTLLCLGTTCGLAFSSPHNKAHYRRPNVVFAIIDDLRPLVDESFRLPNFERLTGKGAYFTNAYAHQALCAPSRHSLLTGRRPDNIHTYDLNTYWRHTAGNYTTLPQYFKENGYQTISVGKIFHPGPSSNYTDDYPYSWSERPYHPPTEIYRNSPVCPDKMTAENQRNLICPVEVLKQPEKTLPDMQSLDYAVEMLKSHKESDAPFFLAVGFHKPHIPLKYPEEYLDRVPPQTVKLPHRRRIPKSLPVVAWHPWMDLKERDDIKRLNIAFPFGITPSNWTRDIKRSYMAASLYVDDLLGELMSHVDFSNTVVVLTSDHGWSLGENGLWAKYSNFDVAVKVPLVIISPTIHSKTISTPVELIDIFPTLVEVTGLPGIPECGKNENLKTCLAGKSLLQFTQKGYHTKTSKYTAISQYPRPSVYPQWNSDKPVLKHIKIMGYTIKTKRYRYTKWIHFYNTNFTRDWAKSYGEELYDHKYDVYEAKNLAFNSNYRKILKFLTNLLKIRVEDTR